MEMKKILNQHHLLSRMLHAFSEHTEGRKFADAASDEEMFAKVMFRLSSISCFKFDLLLNFVGCLNLLLKTKEG